MKNALIAVVSMVSLALPALAANTPCSTQAKQIALQQYQQQTQGPGTVLQLIPQATAAVMPPVYAFLAIVRSPGVSANPTVQYSIVLNAVCRLASPNDIRIVGSAQ